MFRRMILVAGVMLAVLAVLGVSPAHAQYGTGGITLSTNTSQPGQPVTVTASCFQSGTSVAVSMGGTAVGTGVAGADGTVSVTFTVPAGTSNGSYTVSAVGTGCDGQALTQSATLSVVSSSGASQQITGSLPTTGSNTGMMVAFAAVLVTAGGLFLNASRKRRSSVRS